jgi:hypothetical protein
MCTWLRKATKSGLKQRRKTTKSGLKQRRKTTNSRLKQRRKAHIGIKYFQIRFDGT